MTKAALCVSCFDIFAPYRDWQANRDWRWCQCGETGTRWIDGSKGLIELTSLHGPDSARVLGLANSFLVNAVRSRSGGGQWWRDLHDRTTLEVADNYLFHRSKRSCWALVVAVGRSGDVHFTDYATVRAAEQQAVGVALEHSIQDPETGEITVTTRLT